jgi:tetratricopeptide (TPR) repeat protein
VHRDLKPSNIIVAADGAPVLLDFGLAIAEELEGQSLTRTGETAGTPAYLAPELVGGERARPDAQCDVYSLGVTLYECLALRRPFDAPTPAALYNAILSGTAPALRGVPRDLAVVVATALERDRLRRYRSAAALAADLEACVAGLPVAARPLPLAGRMARWARREPRQALLAGLLALATLAAAALGGNWLSSRDEVRAADALARRNLIEDTLNDGYTALSLEHLREAAATFERARALDPHNVEAIAGLVIAGAETWPAAELHALLAELPPETRAFEMLRALVEHRPLPARAGPAELAGQSALDLYLCGLCLEVDCRRLPFSARGARHGESLRCFTEAILRSPAARPLYFQQRAIAAQGALDGASARSAASALLALWPDSPRALYAAGHALALVAPRESVGYLERSIALDPSRRDSYNMLAIACCNAGDPQAAESWCWRALELDPNSAPLVFWLGESMARQNCTEDAREAYVRSIVLDPTSHEPWSKLALLDFVRGDAQSAVRYYAHSLDIDPGMERVRLFYGAALEACGRMDEARAEAQQALVGLFPGDVNFWKSTSNVFQFLKAPQSALIAAEAGLELAPRDAELPILRANAEQALQQAR